VGFHRFYGFSDKSNFSVVFHHFFGFFEKPTEMVGFNHISRKIKGFGGNPPKNVLSEKMSKNRQKWWISTNFQEKISLWWKSTKKTCYYAQARNSLEKTTCFWPIQHVQNPKIPKNPQNFKHFV
jgi:hypothetical protein